MKRKVIPVLIGLLLIVLILAGAAGVFLFQRYSGSKEEADLNAYFGLNGSQEVAIVWNQELTEEKGLLQDERCYLKLDTVHEMLNERFYVDHNEKLLLYTPTAFFLRCSCLRSTAASLRCVFQHYFCLHFL